MNPIIAIVLGIGAVGLLVWLVLGKSAGDSPDAEIDPSDARQIGLLIGMTGGTITDAAVARYALERFEQTHGRKATVREMAIVVGIMMGMR